MKNWIKQGNTVATFHIKEKGEEIVTGVIDKVHDDHYVSLKGFHGLIAKSTLYPCLIWHELDEDFVPEGKVLAANFRKGTYRYGEKLVGYLVVGGFDHEGILCSSEEEVLLNVTHWIDIDSYDIEP